MRRTISIIILLLLGIIQLSLTMPQILPVIPNLMLIYICVSLLFVPPAEAFIQAVIAGIVLDFFSGLPDGVLLLGLAFAIGSAYYFGQMMFTEKYSQYVVVFYVLASTLFFAAFATAFSHALAWFGLTHSIQVNSALLQETGLGVTFDLIFLYPVYLVYRFQSKIGKRFKLKNESI